MTNAKLIKTALAYAGMSEAQLARKFNSSPSAFNQRMKTDKFTAEELEKIAAILNAEYKSTFVFPDGTQIG
jgi:ribosome-binding protein aMBF1 (putative translation factor)